MSESPQPRRQPFGFGKEAPAKSKPAPKPAPKAAPMPAWELVEEEEDAGFEVVDEEPKKAAAAPKKAQPSGVRPAVPAPKKARRADPEPEKSEERDPDSEKPRKKKKKKVDKLSQQLLEKVDRDQESRDAALRHFEWVMPAVVLAIGFVMTVVGAFGVSTINGIVTLGIVCAFVVIFVPLVIAGLMLLGMVVGIEYGRLGPAILKLAAITFVSNGIMCIGDWMRLPGFVVFPISCFICFGIFMTLFDLDVWEANVSSGVVNVLCFVANIILIGFIVVAASSAGGGKDTGVEDDDKPVETRKERKRDRNRDPGPMNPGNNPPVMNDEDDN